MSDAGKRETSDRVLGAYDLGDEFTFVPRPQSSLSSSPSVIRTLSFPCEGEDGNFSAEVYGAVDKSEYLFKISVGYDEGSNYHHKEAHTSYAFGSGGLVEPYCKLERYRIRCYCFPCCQLY